MTNPTEEDIISVRREAELKAIQNGAAPGTVEVSVEVDTQRSIVRAIAVGATELRSKDRMSRRLTEEEILKVVAENLDAPSNELTIAARNGSMYAVLHEKVEKKLFGILKKSVRQLRLVDEEGVIRLQKNNALVRQTTVGGWQTDLDWILEELTVYNDGGVNLPNVYVVLGKRVIDLSGMQSPEQISSLGNVELAGRSKEEPLILAATTRSES